MKRVVLIILLCGLFFLQGLVGDALAGPIGFSVRAGGPGSDDTLYSIDLATGAATAIGSGVGYPLVGGLAFNPVDGILYGVNDTSAQDRLITIDTTTGVGTSVGLFGQTTQGHGLAIVSNGDEL